MKKILLSAVLVTAVSLLVFLGAQTVSRGQSKEDAAANGDKWEYLIVQGGNTNLTGGDGGRMRKGDPSFSIEAYPLERNMDKLGEKGWELVAVSGSGPTYYFKRKK